MEKRVGIRKSVGIVMPCINLWRKYTLPALESVATAQREAAERGVKTEMLLIDNASTDETQAEASKRAGIEYHRNEEQWGFQHSVNFGVRYFLNKGVDLVFVLNNDIVLHPHAIWRLAERFEKGRVGMATCLDATGESWRDPEKLVRLSDVDKVGCPESPNPNFSAFALNKECWDAVGEFDEVFAPAYFEDNDYHYRMKLAGIRAVVYPPAMFLHWGSRTQNEALGAPLISGQEFENKRAAYMRKWGGVPGQEQLKHPYNDESKTIESVKQSP